MRKKFIIGIAILAIVIVTVVHATMSLNSNGEISFVKNANVEALANEEESDLVALGGGYIPCELTDSYITPNHFEPGVIISNRCWDCKIAYVRPIGKGVCPHPYW